MKRVLPFLIAIFSMNASFGQLEAKGLTTNKGIFIGFYQYLPKDAKSNPGNKYPTIIFLHGLGERGNGTTQLSSVLKNGLPKNIAAGHEMKFFWNGKWESFIVLIPQLSANYGSWQNFYVEELIQYAKKNLPVDPDRIHLTGLSLGGGGTWSYADRNKEYADNLASIIPVCGTYKDMDMSPITDSKLPVWAFHAKDDGTVSIDKTYAAISNIMKLNPEVLPVTTYWETGGHGIWGRAYDTAYAWNNPNIYEWMLAQKNNAPVNKRPVANAGNDMNVGINTIATLNGSQSTDADGKIVRYIWKKLAGPKGGNIVTPVSNDGITKTTVFEEPGTFQYELKVIDDRAEYTVDIINIKVTTDNKNLPPKANAGKNLNVSTSSTIIEGSANDEDGAISKINWRQLQGPNSSKMENTETLKLKISNLVNGTYVFRLEVWDNQGAQGYDDVAVIVSQTPQGSDDPNPTENDIPRLNAGKNQYPTVNQIILNGKIDDPGKIISKFNWRQLKGPNTVQIVNPGSLSTTVKGLINGSYIFRLEAWDKDGNYFKDDIGIEVKISAAEGPVVTEETNRPPVANAGKNQNVNTTETELDGSASSDPDQNIKTILWRQLKGPGTATIQSSSTLKTKISGLKNGFYIFRIQVTDEFGLSHFDDIGITVNIEDFNNLPPKAEAGKNQYVYSSVTILDGTNSYDEDGSIVKYNWRKLQGPDSYNIETPNQVKSQLSSLVPGFYVFRLEVWDNKNTMDFDDIGITVYAENKTATAIIKSESLELSLPKEQIHASQDISLNVFPNPAKSTLSIEIKTIETGTGMINIYNSTGKQIQSFRFNKAGNTHKENIAIANLSNGLYYVEVILGNTLKKSTSFIKN